MAFEKIEEEKEWKEGPTDTIDGLNSMVRTLNKCVRAINEMQEANTPVVITAWYPAEERWIYLGVKGYIGGEAPNPPTGCEPGGDGSGASELLGDI